MGGSVGTMVTRVPGGVDVVFEAPRWSERWALEDDATMPETDEHLLTAKLLMDVLVAWIARTGRDAKAGSNLALRWDRAHPKVGVDPDVYLVEPAPPEAKLRSLRTWVKGHHAPRVAVEVVSRRTAKKDYTEGPAKYAASGVRELWIFDPEGHGRGATGESWVLQVWRRTRAGAFRQEHAGEAPAHSDELGAWLVVTDGGARLRLADDEAGAALWPTEAEVERAATGVERAAREVERARADAAEAEIARLRAMLAAR
jgi:Uma2 family endonuclease